MSDSSKVFVLLPAYNEATALRRLIPDIVQTLESYKHPYEIVLVDDGSRDDTTAVVASFPASYNLRRLAHGENRGYGAALATGFQWIINHAAPEDYAVSLDSDNTHPPTYIPNLVKKLEEGCDVVTASYTLEGSHVYGVPPLRRLMSTAANWLFALALPIPGAQTYTNGFRAYRVDALQRARARYGDPLIGETGFPGGTELFIKVTKAGARVGEVPFDLHYENRGSQSKINLPRTITGYLRLIQRIRQLPVSK